MNAVRWAVGAGVFLFVLTFVTSIMTLRYLAREGQFEEALLKNQYLEGETLRLQNRLTTADATLVRIQNFERKLRVLARVDMPSSSKGIGPISNEDEAVLSGSDWNKGGTVVASIEGVPAATKNRMHSLELSVDDLHARSTLQEQSLQELYELLKDQESLLTSSPSVWPTQGWVTSRFGYRVSPYTGRRHMHHGLDIAAPVGTKVLATADGIVTQASTENRYGKLVILNHGYGIVTRYGHNSEILVQSGQKVRRGDIIAMVGNTGRSTGPHLHYEVQVNGVPTNPVQYILE